METTEYTRKPFTVNAVQVSLENVEQIAEWCGGTVEQVKTRLLGTETMLPCVKIPIQSSDSKGSFFKALLGMWVVERKNTFRVYKPNQFDATFEEKPLKSREAVEKIVNEYKAGLVDTATKYGIVDEVRVSKPKFEEGDCVRVNNSASKYFGCVGFVKEDQVNDLVRVDLQAEGQLMTFSPTELERFAGVRV